MIDLKALGIKSAVIIDNPDEVEARLSDADRELRDEIGTASAGTAGTILDRCDDGRLKIAKRHQASNVVTEGFALPAAEKLESMAADLTIPWESGYEKRVVPFWASDERADRHGDIVEQSWKFEEFESNPLLLDGHQWDAPPIGNLLNWEVRKRKEADYNGDALMALALFATKDTYERADVLFRLVQARFLRCVSVGFYPEQIIDVKDDKERQRLGLGRYGYVLRDNHLVELSVVSVPANAGAYAVLQQAKRKNLLKDDDVQVIRELARLRRLAAKDNIGWKQEDSRLIAVWRSLFPTVSVQASDDLERPLLLDEVHHRRTRRVPVNNDGTTATDNGADGEDEPAGNDSDTTQKLLDGQSETISVLNDIRQLLEQLVTAEKGGEDGSSSTQGAGARPNRLSALAAIIEGRGN